jgi:hypothetical protein
MIAAAGCNASALSKREIVVHFTGTATDAEHRAAQAACTGVAPHTSPEPIVHNHYASTRIADVRFRVDHANDNDLAKLYVCLSKQPGVLGVSDPMDMTR